jgi:hypothetical protein
MYDNFRYIIIQGDMPPQSPFEDTGREFNDGKKLYKSYIPSQNGMTWEEANEYIKEHYPEPNDLD